MASQLDPLPIPPHTLGVVADADPEAMPLGALVAAENWIYQDGELRVRPGSTAFGNDINQRPSGLVQYKHNDGNLRTVLATTVGWWKLTAATWSDISGTALTGSATDLNVFRVFQKAGATHLLGTNGANTMKKWDGNAATYSDVGGTPPRARTMMKLFDRIMVGNLLSGGTISAQAVDVCAFQDFDSGWGSVLVAIVGDEPGPIVTMQEMGNLTGAIYKEDELVLAIAQAGTVPFRFESRRAKIPGPASALSVIAPSDGLHLYLSKDGQIMRFDGNDLVSLGNKFQAHINSTAALAQLGRAFAIYDSIHNFAWFFYPEAGAVDPMIGIAINLSNLSLWPFRLPFSVSAAGVVNTNTGLTIGELPGTIGGLTQTIGELASANALKRLLIADTGGLGYEQRGETDGGTAIPFNYRTGRQPLGNGRKYKTVNEIEHRFKKTPAAQNVSVEIGVSDSGDDEVLSTAQTVNLNDVGPYVTGHRHSGKYLSMRLSGSATQSIVYRGSAVAAVERGYR